MRYICYSYMPCYPWKGPRVMFDAIRWRDNVPWSKIVDFLSPDLLHYEVVHGAKTKREAVRLFKKKELVL
jgi:hypothetical protein